MLISNKKLEQGYTLTEMLVVILLTGLVASVASTSIEKMWPSVMLDTQVNQIQADINMMRRQAMLTSQVYEFIIDPTDRLCIIKTQDRVVKKRGWPRKLKVEINLGEGGEQNHVQTVYTASPDGRLEGGTLVFSARNKSETLTVEAFTMRLHRESTP